jgi:hypothetical protein
MPTSHEAAPLERDGMGMKIMFAARRKLRTTPEFEIARL